MNAAPPSAHELGSRVVLKDVARMRVGSVVWIEDFAVLFGVLLDNAGIRHDHHDMIVAVLQRVP